jgi:hypothetical protein
LLRKHPAWPYFAVLVPAHAAIMMRGVASHRRAPRGPWHHVPTGITDARRGTLLSLGAIELRKHPNADAAD